MAQKITTVYKDLFGSAPYSGRSSSIKPSFSKTELNCYTVETETKINKTMKIGATNILKKRT